MITNPHALDSNTGELVPVYLLNGEFMRGDGSPVAAQEVVSGIDPAHTPSETRATVQPPPAEAPALAREQDILAKFLVDARRAGVVGEDNLVATEYLAITSRLLDKPASLVIKGASSSGKSYSTETTCKFFPAKAVVPFTGMSEKALLFSEKSFEHRTLVIFEAGALRERAERQSGDQTAYYLRSLVSEGETHYEMTIKGKDGAWKTQRFEKRGPTNVIITTTAVALHNENETRMLSIPTNDSAGQTKNILLALADEAITPVDTRKWHELQEWLWCQDNLVTVPFARELAENIPPVAVRLRRDFSAVLSLIKSHAVLHQATRDKDEAGKIVATLDDYEAVRAIVLDVVSQGIGATVSAVTRETVAVVAEAGKEITGAEVARRLELDKSAAYRRIRVAMAAGYITNNEERRFHPARYVVGDPLPDDIVILPVLQPGNQDDREGAGQPEGCTVADVSEGVSTQNPATPDPVGGP